MAVVANQAVAFDKSMLTACPHLGDVLRPGLILDDVSALSEARFDNKVHASTVLRRAFDKAVRRKPPVVAADAGPMQIQLWEGTVSRCPEAVRESTTDDTGR
jgi:hypothetical protein